MRSDFALSSKPPMSSHNSSRVRSPLCPTGGGQKPGPMMATPARAANTTHADQHPPHALARGDQPAEPRHGKRQHPVPADQRPPDPRRPLRQRGPSVRDQYTGLAFHVSPLGPLVIVIWRPLLALNRMTLPLQTISSGSWKTDGRRQPNAR